MVSLADHHRFWSTVYATLENLRSEAPEGHVAFVQISLANGETIEPAGVGRLDDSWSFFEIDKGGEQVTAERRVIFIRPEHIARVEIRFRHKDEGGEIGFQVDKPRTVPEQER